ERMLEDQQDRERWNWLIERLERLERCSAGATGGVAPALQRLFSYLSFVSFVAAQLVGVFMSGSDDASPYIHEPSFANGRTQFRPTLKQSTGQRGYVNVPVDWLHPALPLSGTGLVVALVVWRRSRIEKQTTVALTRSDLEEFKLDRVRVRRGLAEIERKGLVRVQHQRGRSPVVTVLFSEGE